MMIWHTDNIHTIRIKATVMKSIAVALVVFAVMSLIVSPIIVAFSFSFEDALGVFILSLLVNVVVGMVGAVFISDLPEALGKIREYEAREELARQREVEEVLRDYDRRRNNY